jgi:alkaline phosphatase
MPSQDSGKLKPMSLSRRAFLGSSAALGLSTLASGAPQFPTRRKEAKNIILIVVDGMAIQVAGAWDHYSRQVHRRRSAWTEILERSDFVHGLNATRSLSSIVTDSAAASSAWGSGRRIYNGQLNIYPDGTKLASIAQLAQARGMKTGMASTARITHATPAGFAIQHPSRDAEDDIAALYLDGGFDVLLGGGSRHFSPAKRQDKRDLLADFRKAGYQTAQTRSESQALRPGAKALGLFWDSHLPYAVDWDQSAEMQAKVPTLAEMTRTAIRLLDNPSGFALQVEAGRVDHAGHANDFAGILFDQREFEAAVVEAVRFAEEDGETLVIITADHATGGPSLNGLGEEYLDSNAAMDRWQGMKASFEVLQPLLSKAGGNDELRDIVRDRLGFELTSAEGSAIAGILKGDFPARGSAFMSNATAALGMVLANHNAVGWTSTNHTSEHVLLSAFGPGAERLRGVTDNTEIFDAMTAALGIRHRNPIISPAEARRAAEKSAYRWIDRDA